MTKCASCRVRHLSCDVLPICNECTKSGRECSRLNVRFKYLVCPSIEHNSADNSKYEFFFSSQQPWIDIKEKTKFVDGTNDAVDTPLNEGLEDCNADTAERHSELRRDTITIEPPTSARVDALTSPIPTTQIPIPIDTPPDYLAATEQGIGL